VVGTAKKFIIAAGRAPLPDDSPMRDKADSGSLKSGVDFLRE